MRLGIALVALFVGAAECKCPPVVRCAELGTPEDPVFVGTVLSVTPDPDGIRTLFSAERLRQLDAGAEETIEEKKRIATWAYPEARRRIARASDLDFDEISAEIAARHPFTSQYLFRVEESFSGRLPSKLTIVAGLGGCGIDFQVNGRYLVFASYGPDRKSLIAPMCAGHREAGSIEEEKLRSLRDRPNLGNLEVWLPGDADSVEVRGGSIHRMTRQDPSFIGIPPGSYEVVALREGVEVAQRPVVIHAGRCATVRFFLSPPPGPR